jgi:hypothetical protein
VVTAAAKELQKQLLAREELTQREEAQVVWEEKAMISEKALVKVSTDLDAGWVKTEATRQEYLDKMCTHTAHMKHTLSLDNMLGEKVLLDGKEQDLTLHEAALTEALAWGLNPERTARS